MSTLLNDTKDTASCMMDSAKDGAEHAASSASSTLFEGIHAVTGVVSMLRGLHVTDALGLFGLARRRGPVGSIALFGAGFAVGAGAGVLFAPMSGSDLRRAMLDRFKGLQQDAAHTLEKVETGAKEIEGKAGTLVGKAKDTVVSVEHKLEDKVAGGLQSARDADKGKSPADAGNLRSAAARPQ
jgi:gas vesicle protein